MIGSKYDHKAKIYEDDITDGHIHEFIWID